MKRVSEFRHAQREARRASADPRRTLRVLGMTVALLCASPAVADLIDEEDPIVVPKPTPSEPDAPPKATKPGAPAKPAQPPKPSPSSSVLAPKGGAQAKKKKTGPKDADQPVHFESKGLRGLREKGTVELVDDVIITQGSLRMEADHAKVYYNEGIKDVMRVVCKGNVKIYKDDEESGEKIKAFGDQVTFENKKRTVVMEGNARLWRGADLVRGKKITYEMETGWIKADRVAGELHPQDEPKDEGGS